MIKSSTSNKSLQGRREVVYGMLETCKEKIQERARKVVYRLVKGFSKTKSVEVGREVVYRLIKFSAQDKFV